MRAIAALRRPPRQELPTKRKETWNQARRGCGRARKLKSESDPNHHCGLDWRRDKHTFPVSAHNAQSTLPEKPKGRISGRQIAGPVLHRRAEPCRNKSNTE